MTEQEQCNLLLQAWVNSQLEVFEDVYLDNRADFFHDLPFWSLARVQALHALHQEVGRLVHHFQTETLIEAAVMHTELLDGLDNAQPDADLVELVFVCLHEVN